MKRSSSRINANNSHGNDASSSALWSFSAPPPPTPTTRPCVPRVQPAPIHLSSSYQGEDLFSLTMASPSRSLNHLPPPVLSSSFQHPPHRIGATAACNNGSGLSRGEEEELDTILSMLKQPSPRRSSIAGAASASYGFSRGELSEEDDDNDARMHCDVEDELQFNLTLS
eukprot:TRINITY_DN2008_c0_g1_i1.p1 TRINITY_DN2008_c0_g1~~TRINITY_DN2008_c0_g1_i1.p1  ORF type:complete len:169 (+),score=34.16 TRINITY_DN2008_c0_g1_i1:205-711(+)